MWDWEAAPSGLVVIETRALSLRSISGSRVLMELRKAGMLRELSRTSGTSMLVGLGSYALRIRLAKACRMLAKTSWLGNKRVASR